MASYALVEVEGVLLEPDRESYAASPPIPIGVLLVHALAHQFKVALSSATREEIFGHWLAQHRPLPHTALFCDRLPAYPGGDHFDLVRQIGTLDLVVTAEPHVAMTAVNDGIAVCCFAHPTTRYTGPPELRPWMEIAHAQRSRNQEIQEALRQTADLGPYE